MPLWADNGLYYAFRPHGPEVPTWMDRVACPGGARRLSDCTSAIPACSRNQQVGEFWGGGAGIGVAVGRAGTVSWRLAVKGAGGQDGGVQQGGAGAGTEVLRAL